MNSFASLNFLKIRCSYGLSLLAFIFFGSFLRFFWLTHQSLWWDEGFSLQNSGGDNWLENLQIVRNIHNADKFQPLYPWILFHARQVFGSSEYVLRGTSALFGILTLPIIYLSACRFYHKRHALWAILLAATSAFLIYYSQEVRNYSLLIFLSALQLYCISEVILYGKNYRLKFKWAHALLVGLGLFASIQAVIFSAGLSVSHFLINRRWREWLAWWVPAALSAVPALIYFATLPGTIDPGEVSVSRATQPLTLNLAFVAYGVLVGTTYGPDLESLRGTGRWPAIIDALPALLILLVVGLGLVYFLCKALVQRADDRELRRSDRFLLYLLLSSSLFGVLFAIFSGMSLVPRHAFYLWVQLPILLPIVLYDEKLRTGIIDIDRIKFIPTIFLILLIVLNFYSAANYFFDGNHWRDDYRGVAQYFIGNDSDIEQKILFSGEADILRYYGVEGVEGVGGKRIRMLAAGDPAWLEGVNKKAGEASKILLAIYRPAGFHKADIRGDLSAEYLISEEIDKFKGFKVFRLIWTGS